MALYVYALLDRAPRTSLRGITGEAMRFVRCGLGLVAAVGEIERPPAVRVASMRKHDRAVRRLADAVPAILPARFGSMVGDRAELAALVRPRLASLVAALAIVRDRRQMTLRAIRTSARGGSKNPSFASARDRSATALDAPAPAGRPFTNPVGRPFTGRQYLEARLRKSQRAQQVPELDRWRSAVAPLVVAERIERSPGLVVVASVHHLIDRRAVRAYKSVVRRVGGLFRGIRVTMSGPWPPYAFGGIEAISSQLSAISKGRRNLTD